MIIDEPGLYRLTERSMSGDKAEVVFCHDCFCFGFINSNQPHMWNMNTGAEIGDWHNDIISKYQDPEIPLDFDFDCLPGWATGKVKYIPSDGNWEFETKNKISCDVDWEYVQGDHFPEPPYPPGYEDGRVFERPNEVEVEEKTLGVKILDLDAEPPEATEEKTCLWCKGVNLGWFRVYTGFCPNCDRKIVEKEG